MPTTRDLPPADRALRGRLASVKHWTRVRTPEERRAATEPARIARRARKLAFIAVAKKSFPELSDREAERVGIVLHKAFTRLQRDLLRRAGSGEAGESSAPASPLSLEPDRP